MSLTARPKIADVAKSAGVSIPTVSKVLNGRAHVAEATRQRVNDAVKNLGYTKGESPSLPASRQLQLVVNNFDSPWVLQILDGAEEAAHRLGFELSCVRATHIGSETWRKQRSAHLLAGVVLLAPHRGSKLVTALTQLNIPGVALDPQGSEPLTLPTVSAANFSGALKAVEFLIKLGHTRIGMVTGGDAQSVRSRDRFAAYSAALLQAGLTLDPQLVRDGDFSQEAGFRLGGELLDAPQRPTAIFAGNDLQAVGLLSAANARGLRVPQDLSVVGFDDIALAQMASPALTTVRQPLHQMADMAITLLADQIKGHLSGPREVELATTLIERASTGHLPG